jgi:phosphatidate cytidylyltransferase
MINVLFVLLVVWTSDIGAYIAGRALGGPKLAPRISPGKTWSGAAGGTLAAVAVGVVLQLGWPHGSMAQAIGVTAALSIVSQLGDLFESGVKRYYGAKDSSRLIPGHGGLLDRLDGVLAAAPAAALLAMWLGPGVTLW